MSFGIVLTIKADLGVSAWDVLHIGLYKQFGLSIGSWTIMIGGLVLFSASLLTRKLPQVGAFINMFTIGIFIDLFLYIPVLKTPEFFRQNDDVVNGNYHTMLWNGFIYIC